MASIRCIDWDGARRGIDFTTSLSLPAINDQTGRGIGPGGGAGVESIGIVTDRLITERGPSCDDTYHTCVSSRRVLDADHPTNAPPTPLHSTGALMLPLVETGAEEGLIDVVVGSGPPQQAGVAAEAVRSAQLHRWYEAFRPWTIK